MLYKEYESGVEVSENTTIVINIPNFEDKEYKNISIVVINNTNKTIELNTEYNNEPSISYTVEDLGVYTVYAILKNKEGGEETIDLTDKLSFETNYNTSDSNFVY